MVKWKLMLVMGIAWIPLTVACSESSQPLSNTPQITSDPSAGELLSLLLTEEEVIAVDGLEDAVAQEIGDAPVFENPDPRGPCGAPVGQLPLAGGTGRMFSGGTAAAVEFVVPRTADTDAYLAQLLADRHVGCEAFQSLNNQGQPQTIGDVEFVELPGLPEEALAWTATFSVAGGRGYAGLVCFQTAGHFVLLQLQSLGSVGAGALQVLAVTAYQKAAVAA